MWFAGLPDHIIDHDFLLIDIDGTPTRWGVYSPKLLTTTTSGAERGLKSLSILSYLAAAAYITGDGNTPPRQRKPSTSTAMRKMPCSQKEH
jgi:hypothetical protein